MSPLSCVTSLVVNYVEAYVLCESSPFVVIWVRGDVIPLDDLPLSNMSRLKSPARIIWDVG